MNSARPSEAGAGRRFLAALCGLLCALGAAEARAQTVETELQEIEQELEREDARGSELEEEANNLEEDIQALRDKLIRAAAAVQQHQVELGAIEEDLETIEELETEKVAALDLSRADLRSSLRALTRLGRHEPEALALMPQAWVEAMRSARLLQHLVPALQSRAGQLVDDLKDLAELRAAKAEALAAQSVVADDISRERNRLELLLRRKSTLQDSIVAEKRQIELKVSRLSEQADDLRDLVAALAAQPTPAPEEIAPPSLSEDEMLIDPDAPPGSAPADDATAAVTEVAAPAANQPAVATAARVAAVPRAAGSLPYPAHGDIVQRFGDPIESNRTSVGMAIQTGADAQVVAPRDGLVVFAGMFRSYGQLLIIEYSDEYHILMSGFSRIDSREGEWLRAGEPVGVMGPESASPPQLYVEVRRSGRPINPDVWLASNNRKVSG